MNWRDWLLNACLLLLRAARERNGIVPLPPSEQWLLSRPEPVSGVFEGMEE